MSSNQAVRAFILQYTQHLNFYFTLLHIKKNIKIYKNISHFSLYLYFSYFVNHPQPPPPLSSFSVTPPTSAEQNPAKIKIQNPQQITCRSPIQIKIKNQNPKSIANHSPISNPNQNKKSKSIADLRSPIQIKIQNPQRITRRSPIKIQIKNQNPKSKSKSKIKTRNPPPTHATAAPPDPRPHQSQTHHRQKPTQLADLHPRNPNHKPITPITLIHLKAITPISNHAPTNSKSESERGYMRNRDEERES